MIPSAIDFARRPMLVFWETTQACALACRHCRASATLDRPAGELSTAEGIHLIEEIASFGRPAPVLILTGGDCLQRADLFTLIEHATSVGVPVALAPSVTPLLDPGTISRIAESGVRAVSVSLDGADPATHDGVRGVPDHHRATVQAIRALAATGLPVQVNTTVLGTNVTELADCLALILAAGARIWEVFFLVNVGRGTAAAAIGPDQHEEVCHFLFEASRYPVTVRTVEAPFYRRVVAQRAAGGPPPAGVLYQRLTSRLGQLLGPPTGAPSARTAATRDGKGIIFVGYDGTIFPAGFLPEPLGNVRTHRLGDVYRQHPLLIAIRAGDFTGRCGRCEYADLCGGSRARAYASWADPLGDDPACPYQPGSSQP